MEKDSRFLSSLLLQIKNKREGEGKGKMVIQLTSSVP